MNDKDTVVVPCVPTEEMWGGLARQIVLWMDMHPKTPRALFDHLRCSGHDVPQWLRDEPEMQNLDHVPSKGTRAVLIYRAMLAAAPSTSVREEELADALVGIHQARLHNGRDEGWGWDIGLLNRAMDVALPLIGQPRPERMSHEERTALRARFDALLDADRAALKPSTDKGERDGR